MMINEGISRNGTHSKEFGLWLVDRSAPTPSEKEIKESVPFMNGAYDFSNFLGERVFENRTITYVFENLERKYANRKSLQTAIENWLMRDGFSRLDDDHAKGYYYMAKCSNVNVVDEYGGLRATVEFEAYPFKVAENPEGSDIWDDFNFELDVSQSTIFTVNGSATITLLNQSVIGIAPKIVTNNPVTIALRGTSYSFESGETESNAFRLLPGTNALVITGNATVEFVFYKELI